MSAIKNRRVSRTIVNVQRQHRDRIRQAVTPPTVAQVADQLRRLRLGEGVTK